MVFVARKEKDRGPPKQSLITEDIMLQKIAGVMKAPPAGLEEKRFGRVDVVNSSYHLNGLISWARKPRLRFPAAPKLP